MNHSYCRWTAVLMRGAVLNVRKVGAVFSVVGLWFIGI
jgi:hypothetical protein